jgi:hypothetical protein
LFKFLSDPQGFTLTLGLWFQADLHRFKCPLVVTAENKSSWYSLIN